MIGGQGYSLPTHARSKSPNEKETVEDGCSNRAPWAIANSVGADRGKPGQRFRRERKRRENCWPECHCHYLCGLSTTAKGEGVKGEGKEVSSTIDEKGRMSTVH